MQEYWTDFVSLPEEKDEYTDDIRVYVAGEVEDVLAEKEKQIKRLREVLEYYADESKYEYTWARSLSLCIRCGGQKQDRYEPDILMDNGLTARRVLGE